jgi:LytR cell envelope-related transcriptional attenuator
MSSAEVDHQGVTAVPGREQAAQARQRRQTRTFLGVTVTVLLIGLLAFGNWRWWGIGTGVAAPVPCPVQAVTKPELTNVTVMNGTARAGLATAVAKELKKRHFSVASVGTEDSGPQINAVAEVRYGPAGKLAARTVALQFPAKVKMVQDDHTEGVDVTVVIGARYKAMVTAKKGAAAIKMKPEPVNCVPPTDVAGVDDTVGS